MCIADLFPPSSSSARTLSQQLCLLGPAIPRPTEDTTNGVDVASCRARLPPSRLSCAENAPPRRLLPPRGLAAAKVAVGRRVLAVVVCCTAASCASGSILQGPHHFDHPGRLEQGVLGSSAEEAIGTDEGTAPPQHPDHSLFSPIHMGPASAAETLTQTRAHWVYSGGHPDSTFAFVIFVAVAAIGPWPGDAARVRRAPRHRLREIRTALQASTAPSPLDFVGCAGPWG